MYREVTMIELREVLRLWREGLPKKRLAAQLGLDPKTVRRYLAAAEATGLQADAGALSDEELRDVLLAPTRPAVARAAMAGLAAASTARRFNAGSQTACASRRFANSLRVRACRLRIPPCIASPSSNCSLAARRRRTDGRSRCSMTNPVTSFK